MSVHRTVHIPTTSDPDVEPLFEPLFQLEFAAAVAVDALRAHHAAIEGALYSGELDEVTASHTLARECDELLELLREHRRRALDRLARELSEQPR